ncbi:porin [Solimonas variicoloris]|uniref:porin n=1 Tax=Solimonas variicoloris TaxID=254408 RepID=UPI000361BB2A|nr:porin [Solimonas variicoloris]
MNKNLLAIAVGAVFAIPSAAFADTKVYGKFNIGLDSQKDEIGLDFNKDKTVAGKDNTWKFRDNNNSSRLGFKGDQDVGLGDLKVIYQLEYGIDPDGSEGSPFSERNIFVGLKGGWGTMKFGKYDTPVKVSGEKADQFNDTIGDDTNLMAGETRANNMIQYTSPTLGDMFSFNVAIAPGEGRAAADDNSDLDNGLADTYYASLVFDMKMVYASLAYAGNEVSGLKVDGSPYAIDILRATVAVKPITDLEIAALYQQAQGVDRKVGGVNDNASDKQDNTWMASVGYSISAFKLKAQYGQTKGDDSDYKRKEMAFGVDYKLSKSLVSQLYYVAYEQDKPVTLGTAPATETISKPKTDTVGVALVYTF